MAKNKTQPNAQDALIFLTDVENPQKREDCFRILEIMKEITQEEPVMWGTSIVGFGSYHYKYESGREGDFFLSGFSPRKQNITLYIMAGFKRYGELMEKLGKHKTGKSCLYIKKLADVDEAILKELIQESVGHMKRKYHGTR